METKYKMTQTAESKECYTFTNDNNNQTESPNVSPVNKHTECAVDNSNGNNGVTLTNMMEPHIDDQLDTHETFAKYNEINYNVSPSFDKENSSYQDDSCLIAPEIMITMHKQSGEIHFDVVSIKALEYFDKEIHSIVASTFDGLVTNRYKDIFHPGIVDISISNTREDNPDSTYQGDDLHNNVKLDGCVSYYASIQHRTKNDLSTKANTVRSPGGGDYCAHNVNLQTDTPQPTPDKTSQLNKENVDKNVRFDAETNPKRDGFDSVNTRRTNGRSFTKHSSGGNLNDYNKGSNRESCNRRYGYNYQKNYKKEVQRTNDRDNHDINKQRRVISFSENDLIYLSKNEKQNKNYKTEKSGNHAKKQIMILPRGCTLDKLYDEKSHHLDAPKVEINQEHKMDSKENKNIADARETVPYGKYSRNITNGRKHYNNKRAVYGDMEVDADDSGDANEEQNKMKKRSNKYRTGSKQRPRKPKKRVPKTLMEQFQIQFKAGQMKSVFSRWKTETLKRVKLVEHLHNGTFAIKYKAIYNSEMVVLSVYIDQDTSDINAVDMVHMRNSKFVNGLRDCITGPYSSLWLLSPYYPLGDLQKLLSRDPERHVIGEVHAQFITAGLMFALDYLHENDIVHGNIKPSKILMTRNGFPVLTGYLLVGNKVLEEQRDVYTPAYAAPERFRGNRGSAIDIFSVGCVAYEIVAGRTPFDDGNMQALRANILDFSYRPVFEPELFSYAGEMFIDSCIRKSLKYRFTIGPNRENFLFEEWFSTLDLYQIQRQDVYSPILQAMKQIEKSATLPWNEKTVEFNWGRALDITCPDLEPLGVMSNWRYAQDFLLDFFG